MTYSEKRCFYRIGLAFSIALGVAISALAVLGIEKGIPLGLVVTGRIAFLFFFLAYVGGPLTTLFGAVFAPLRKSAREYGLAFAAVIIVHLGLVLSLCVTGRAPGIGVFVIFGPAAVFTGLLTLLSFSCMRMLLPENFWPPIRVIATTYILFAFIHDFVQFSSSSSLRHLIAYVPFAALSIASLLLKIAAWAKSLGSAAFAYRAPLRAVPPKGRPQF